MSERGAPTSLNRASNGSWLAGAGIQRHTASHLVWGPIARHIPAPAIVWPGVVLLSITRVCRHPASASSAMGDIVDIGVFICLAYFVSRLGKMQFAAFGWLVTKISLGIAAFMMAAVGAPMLFEQRSPDAPIILALGLLRPPRIA